MKTGLATIHNYAAKNNIACYNVQNNKVSEHLLTVIKSKFLVTKCTLKFQ